MVGGEQGHLLRRQGHPGPKQQTRVVDQAPVVVRTRERRRREAWRWRWRRRRRWGRGPQTDARTGRRRRRGRPRGAVAVVVALAEDGADVESPLGRGGGGGGRGQRRRRRGWMEPAEGVVGESWKRDKGKKKGYCGSVVSCISRGGSIDFISPPPSLLPSLLSAEKRGGKGTEEEVFFFSDHFRERRGRDRNCLLAQFNSRPTTDWVGKSSSLSLSFLDRETFFSFLPPFLLLFTYLRVKQFSLRVVSGGKKKKERNREDGSRHNRRGRESRERRGKSAIY